MSFLGVVATGFSIRIARTLRSFPSLLSAYLPKAHDYIDWRWATTNICKTEFGSKMRCQLNDLIQRKIAYFGVWEPNLTYYFYNNLREGDVVIDVGANIGYFTLLASTIVGDTGQVISIEASPQIYNLLTENVALNNRGNIRAVNFAAAYAEGEMPVYAASKDNIGRSSTIPIDGNTLTGKVKALPLQDILTQEELSRVRLVKIDIEGAEHPVIRSILENINIYGPDCEIAVEVSVANGRIIDEMLAHGFKAYQLSNSYSDQAYIERRVENPTAFSGAVERQTDFIFSRKDTQVLMPTASKAGAKFHD